MAITTRQEHNEPSLAPADRRHVGCVAAELAACVHAVGLLVHDRLPGAIATGSPAAPVSGHTTFELLGRRVAKVLDELERVAPGTEWNRPTSGRAIARVPAREAESVWRGLLEAGRRHGLASVGAEAAARYRLLEASAC